MEGERSRIRAVQMNNLKGLLCIKRMDSLSNAQIRELCRVTKGVEKRIDKGILKWLGHVEKMERNMIAKSVYVGVCW